MMPNIMLFGFSDEANNLACKMHRFAEKAAERAGEDGVAVGEKNDFVVTIVRAKVTSADGKSEPFVRVVSDSKEEAQWIAEVLADVGLTVEVLILHCFIAPAEVDPPQENPLWQLLPVEQWPVSQHHAETAR